MYRILANEGSRETNEPLWLECRITYSTRHEHSMVKYPKRRTCRNAISGKKAENDSSIGYGEISWKYLLEACPKISLPFHNGAVVVMNGVFEHQASAC